MARFDGRHIDIAQLFHKPSPVVAEIVFSFWPLGLDVAVKEGLHGDAARLSYSGHHKPLSGLLSGSFGPMLEDPTPELIDVMLSVRPRTPEPPTRRRLRQ